MDLIGVKNIGDIAINAKKTVVSIFPATFGVNKKSKVEKIGIKLSQSDKSLNVRIRLELCYNSFKQWQFYN